jgi:hypothetical protein
MHVLCTEKAAAVLIAQLLSTVSAETVECGKSAVRVFYFGQRGRLGLRQARHKVQSTGRWCVGMLAKASTAQWTT